MDVEGLCRAELFEQVVAAFGLGALLFAGIFLSEWSISGIFIPRGGFMRRRGKDTLFDVLLGTGLDLLDLVRDRAADHAESLSETAKDVYDTARGRVRNASRAITGEDRSGLGSAAALVLGVGVGVALGIVFAPASGEQVRRNIGDAFQKVGGRIRSRVGGEPRESGPAERL